MISEPEKTEMEQKITPKKVSEKPPENKRDSSPRVRPDPTIAPSRI